MCIYLHINWHLESKIKMMIIIIIGTKRYNLKDCLDRDNEWLH